MDTIITKHDLNVVLSFGYFCTLHYPQSITLGCSVSGFCLWSRHSAVFSLSPRVCCFACLLCCSPLWSAFSLGVSPVVRCIVSVSSTVAEGRSALPLTAPPPLLPCASHLWSALQITRRRSNHERRTQGNAQGTPRGANRLRRSGDVRGTGSCSTL